MKKSEFASRSFLNALGVLAYILAITRLLSNKSFFAKIPESIAPIFILLLLIISASITGFLVLGKPIALYLSGLKKEGVIVFFATLAWLATFVATIVAVLLLK